MAGSARDRRDLLIKIAKLYYLEDLSQQQIADRINTSRANVSKLLKAARDNHIVHIRIEDASAPDHPMATALIQIFNLKKTIIVPSRKDPEQTKVEIGRAAADLVSDLIGDGIKIGITGGSTIYHLVNQFRSMRLSKVEVYQLMGGISTRELNMDGRDHAQNLANKLNAKCYILQTPLIVQNEHLREMLLKEPEIMRTLGHAEHVDLAVASLGSNDPDQCSLVKMGYLSREEAKILLDQGAVGDLCGWHIDINGRLCPLEIHNRLIALDLSAIRNIPNMIAVAMGAHKAEIILGSLAGGYIDMLVTDEDAAGRVLALAGQRGQSVRQLAPGGQGGTE